MPWDLFLMKKLIKSEVCGSMNSTSVYCSWKKSQHKLLKKKKRKKRRKRRKRKRSREKLDPNMHLIFTIKTLVCWVTTRNAKRTHILKMESIISFYRDTKYPIEISLMRTGYSRHPL